MAKTKIDGVVEAVRYGTDGQVDWVRAYLRHGMAFSDRVILDRQSLIEQLNAGKQFFAGRRVQLMGGTFETGEALHVLQKNGREVLVTGDIQADQDRLEGIPLI